MRDAKMKSVKNWEKIKACLVIILLKSTGCLDWYNFKINSIFMDFIVFLYIKTVSAIFYL